MGQWLRLCTPKAGGPGSILGWETGLQSLQTSTETYPHVTAKDSICHNQDPAQPNKKIKINVKKNQNTWVPLQFTSAPCHPPVFNMPGLTLSGTNVGSSGQSLSKAKQSGRERMPAAEQGAQTVRPQRALQGCGYSTQRIRQGSKGALFQYRL